MVCIKSGGSMLRRLLGLRSALCLTSIIPKPAPLIDLPIPNGNCQSVELRREGANRHVAFEFPVGDRYVARQLLFDFTQLHSFSNEMIATKWDPTCFDVLCELSGIATHGE